MPVLAVHLSDMCDVLQVCLVTCSVLGKAEEHPTPSLVSVKHAAGGGSTGRAGYCK